jgi:AcrR family transcriptional regulator
VRGMPPASAPSPRPAPPRRTQAERRAATQAALLDATLTCLVERGYSGATTTEICAAAGVSQGALFRYFPTKADLLIAAIERLYGRLFEIYREGLAAVAAADDRVAAAVRLLWETFRRPDLLAALELYVAARTDSDLRGALTALEAPHEERTLALAADLFPDAASDPNFRPGVQLILDTVQGAAIRSVALDDHAAIEAELTLLTELARGVLDRALQGV